MRPLSILLPLLCSATAYAAAPTDYLLAYKGPAPKIDGALDDACWDAASTAFPFLVQPSGYPAAAETLLMASFDQSRLVVALECKCGDPQKLRAADGDLTLNDRVELLIRWPKGDEVSMLIDAAGRHRGGPDDVRIATGRTDDAYVVELSLPKPADAEHVDIVSRRVNEITGEISTWGTQDSMSRVDFTSDPGPAVKIRRFRRQPRGKETITVRVTNPLDRHVAVRCRFTLEENTELMPHLIRLPANQHMATALAYQGNQVSDTGMDIVIDEPQGRQVYMRSRHFALPPGRSFAPRVPVIPHPKKYKLADEETAPFVLKAKCRIVVGRKTNEVERHAATLLRDEVKRRFGIELPITRRSYFIPYPSIVIATSRTTLLAKRLAEKFQLEWYDEYPSQTYILGVRKDLIGIAGLNDTGTLYGVYSFLQLLDTAVAGEGMAAIPALTIRDHPDAQFRGMVWRAPVPHLAAAREALARYKVNLLTGLPEADAAAARADGIVSATLTLPQSTGVTAKRPPATLHLEPLESMPRPLRRALRLPIGLAERHVEPPPEPTAEELEAARQAELDEKRRIFQRDRLDRRMRGHAKLDKRPIRDPETVEPVLFAWVPTTPYALNDTAPNVDDRDDVVGICGGLTDGESLLPPSWAAVVATAEYGWSPNVPDPSDFDEVFYKSFYGTDSVRRARDLLERATACLPRQTTLAALLTHDWPLPAPPRDDLADLVAAAKTEAARATRNRELALLLAASGDRVLAAATNVRTALRIHALYTEAERLAHEQSKPKEAATRCSAMAVALAEARKNVETLLGEHAPKNDLATYRSAEEAAKKLAAAVTAEGRMPPPERFWPMLRGNPR